MFPPQFVPDALLAQTSGGARAVREEIVFEFGRVAEYDDPRLMWIGLGVALIGILGYSIWIYLRERKAVPKLVRICLPLLRCAALLALASEA